MNCKWTQKYLGISLSFITPYYSFPQLLPSTKNLDPCQLLYSKYDFFKIEASKLANMHYFRNCAFSRYQIWPKNASCSSGDICKILWLANRGNECDKCFSVRFESGVTLLTRGHCTSPYLQMRQLHPLSYLVWEPQLGWFFLTNPRTNFDMYYLN